MRYLPSPPKKLVWTVMSQLEIIIQICDLGSMKGCALQRSYSTAAMHSISTRAPFGRVLTAKAQRAGNGALKNSE